MTFSVGGMAFPSVPWSRVATVFTGTENRLDVSRGCKTGLGEELLLVCVVLEIMAVPEQLCKM